MGIAGDKIQFEEGASAVLLCARCKQPVQSGTIHECKETLDEKAKDTKDSEG